MKIFSVNFQKSINDKYGAVATLGSTAKLANDEKGMALKCNSQSTDYITYGDIAAINAIGTGEFSFVVGANIKGFLNHSSAVNSLSGKGAASINGFLIKYVDTTTITAGILSSNINSSFITNKNNIYIITRNSAGLCTFYVNGISQGTPVTQTGSISSTNLMAIGYDGAFTERTPKASIYLSEVYNHCLSNTEIQKLTSDFQNQFPISKPKRGFMLNKPTDLSSQKDKGLIAAYNMVKQSNTLVDISGNNKNGTQTNCISTKDGIALYGNSKVILGNIGNVRTVQFRIKLNSTSEKILEKAANSGLIYVTTGTLTASDFDTKYVNGVVGTVMTAGVWYNVQLTNATDVVFSAATLGLNNTTYGNFEIQDLRFYNRVLSIQEIKDYHNSFILPTLIETFETEPADNQVRVPKKWEQVSGSYKVNEIITPNLKLKSITKGTKVLECVTAGVIAIPSNTAYGSWEFDWYKGADNNYFLCKLIGSNNLDFTKDSANYVFDASNNENIALIKGSAGSIMINSANSYITINTWYRIKISRTNAGVFTLLIKGGNFTPTAGYDGWTLVSTSGGSGTNPVTDNTYQTSNYFVLDLDAGDRFANLVIKNGIKV